MADGTCEVKVHISGVEPFAAFISTVADVYNQLAGIHYSPGPVVTEQIQRLGQALRDFGKDAPGVVEEKP